MKKEFITLAELNPHGHPTTPEQENNLLDLHRRLNDFRAVYGKPMIISSGLRTMEEHRAIYRRKGLKQIPLGSKHLVGAAADIVDNDGKLARFCLDNIPLLKQLGLYIEDPLRTSGWVHLQSLPPVSGNTVFQP